VSTKYYLTKKYPWFVPVGPYAGTWDSTNERPAGYFIHDYTWLLAQTNTDGGVVSLRPAITRNSNDPTDVIFHRWVTPPLEAQTISGTLNINQMVSVFVTGTGPAASAVFKLHAYVTVGQSLEVRSTLLNNYVDSAAWAGATGTHTTLSAAQTLATQTCSAGDSVVVEIGSRISVSGTYTSPISRPPNEYANVRFSLGTQTSEGGAAAADGVVGSTTLGASYVEFSHTFTEQSYSGTIPTNIDGASATVIAALPFTETSDTTHVSSTLKRVWYTWTAPSTQRMMVHTLGSTYWARVDGFVGSDTGATISYLTFDAKQRFTAMCAFMFEASAGTTYYFRIQSSADVNNAQATGGILVFTLLPHQDVADGDVLIASSGWIARYTTDGVLVDLSTLFSTSKLSGLAIDTTHRSLNAVTGGTHAGDRLVVGDFGSGNVLLLELANPRRRIDSITDVLLPSVGEKLSALTMTATGQLVIGWFGNGFTFMAANVGSWMDTSATSGTAPLAVTDAAYGDIQPGAPFAAATYLTADLDVGGTNYVEFDQTGDVVWYTSGGWYRPIGGQIVKRYNITTDTQLADFATLPTGPGPNPGLKGLFPLPDTPTTPGGGCLVCNGAEVRYLNASGTTVRTYAPSGALGLTDVELTSDGEAFWTFDDATMVLYKYDIETGDLLVEVSTALGYNEATSLVVYRADAFPAPPAGTLEITAPPAVIDLTGTVTGPLPPAPPPLAGGLRPCAWRAPAAPDPVPARFGLGPRSAPANWRVLETESIPPIITPPPEPPPPEEIEEEPPDESPEDVELLSLAAGASIQDTLDLPRGELPRVIELADGTYTGAVVCSYPVTIRPVRALPVGRVTEAYQYVTLTSSAAQTIDVPGTEVTLQGLCVTNTNKLNQLIRVRGTTTLIDRCVLLGSPTTGMHRGIEANGTNTEIRRCHIDYIWDVGRDTQAIAGWNGTNGLLIDDCYLSAAAEVVLMGGSDSSSAEMMPQDITLTNSTLTKRTEWYGMHAQIKTAFELKAASGVTVQDCIFEYAGVAEGQSGFLILLSIRNQNGGATWSTVEHVLMERITGHHCGAGILLLGHDTNYPSGTMTDITLRDITIDDVNRRDPTMFPGTYKGNGRLFSFMNAPADVTIERVTMSGTNITAGAYFIQAGQPPPTGMVIRDYRYSTATYPLVVAGSTGGITVAAVRAYAPDIVLDNLVMNGVRLSGT
jgi:hypothetical protein